MKSQVTTDALVAPLGVWSQAIKVEAGSNLLFVSGLTSRSVDGSVFGVGDIEAQTTRVLENLSAILDAAGATMADVVKVTVFVRDIEEFATIHAVPRPLLPGAVAGVDDGRGEPARRRPLAHRDRGDRGSAGLRSRVGAGERSGPSTSSPAASRARTSR